MKFKSENNKLTVWLAGRIDSGNAAETETELNSIRDGNPSESLILDCEKLEYISSAGLRVILRTRKAVSNIKLVNVGDTVYDILNITGFTEMMDIQRAYREISVEGCEVIGEGANGKVYRLSSDSVVKVYRHEDSLPEIERERELARTAFILGVPTAIPYLVVRVKGGGYGSVFELLNAKSFAKLLSSGEKTPEEVAEMSIALLKGIHAIEVKPDSMPSMRELAIEHADYLRGHLPKETHKKLYRMIEAIPEDLHMLHGDYHLKNITRQGDENLIIDMDTLCHGHPVFELASMYNAYCGFSETDPNRIRDFLGIDQKCGEQFWKLSLERYLNTTDAETLRAVENKARIIGYMRLLRRCIRRNGYETEAGRKEIAYDQTQLIDLISRVDSLVF